MNCLQIFTDFFLMVIERFSLSPSAHSFRLALPLLLVCGCCHRHRHRRFRLRCRERDMQGKKALDTMTFGNRDLCFALSDGAFIRCFNGATINIVQTHTHTPAHAHVKWCTQILLMMEKLCDRCGRQGINILNYITQIM